MRVPAILFVDYDVIVVVWLCSFIFFSMRMFFCIDKNIIVRSCDDHKAWVMRLYGPNTLNTKKRAGKNEIFACEFARETKIKKN